MKNKAARSKLIKAVCILLAVCAISGLFGGCYDQKEIDDLAYVIAIGLDKGETNILRMTLQVAVPKSISGGGGGGGGGGGAGSPTTITTVETPTLYAGLNMINNYVSKELNLSHAKAVIFSEELAREGVNGYIHAMMRSREFRGNMYVLVARGSAEEFIRETKPELEINPAKYFEMNFESYKYTGFTANTQLINFYLQEECTCSQAVATLAGVSKFSTSKDFSIEGATYREDGKEYPLEGDYKAGDIPKVGEVKSEIMGLAVFDGDKMVGELDGEDAAYYLMTVGNYNHSYMSIPDPLEKDKFVLLNIKQSRRPVRDVKMEGDKPIINAKIKLEADILSIQSGRNYESVENMPILEKGAEDFLKNGILRFLNRTAKEYKSDICAFGKSMKGKFLTWEKWTALNWLAKYKDAEFNVDVDLKIRRPGLMIRSEPTYGSMGEVIE